MTVLELIVYLFVAGVCGATARAIAGGTGRGFVLSVFLGFLGAFIGVWFARLLHLPLFIAVAIGGHSFPIVWSIVGGFVLVTVTHVLMRPRFRYLR